MSTSGNRPFVVVRLFEATSDVDSTFRMFSEDFALIYASSVEGARSAVERAGREPEAQYRNAVGEQITWSLKRIVDIAPVLDEDLSRDADLYSRTFDRLEPYDEITAPDSAATD